MKYTWSKAARRRLSVHISDQLPIDDSSAERVFAHVSALWEDQVAYASSLVDRRKSLSTIVALLLGLGIFKLEFFRRATDVPVFDGSLGEWLAFMLTVAAISLLSGMYLLVTERPFFRVQFTAATSWGGRHARYLWRVARATTDQERAQLMPEPAPSRRIQGRALQAVLPDSDDLDDWLVLPPTTVLRLRAEGLRNAYIDLRARNERVADRLREALIGLFLAFVLAVATVVVYLWTI